MSEGVNTNTTLADSDNRVKKLIMETVGPKDVADQKPKINLSTGADAGSGGGNQGKSAKGPGIGNSGNRSGPRHSNNWDGGNQFQRGGGPGRNFVGRNGGGGGGSGRGGRGGQDQHTGNFERGRPHFQDSTDNFDGPQRKKMKVQGPDGRVIDKLLAIQGPSSDLPPKKFELKKFLANTRLYIGNIANEVTEAELKELFVEYGEIEEVFVNREKNFAFLKLDYRTNAEKARAELDQKQVKGRPIKVRFAPSTVRIRVKNLSPVVSNELLELAFSVFGDIERAMVFVDEKGKSIGEGIVDYTRKNNAVMAHKYCTEKCYFLTADLRPVITEIGDMSEVDEGLLEMNVNKREFNKNRENEYYKSREVGPRIAEDGSFEANYGEKYKILMKEYKEKEIALKEEMHKELDELQTKMEIARWDHETEMLRQQLRQREIDQERHKMAWEGRMQRVARNFGGGFNNGRGDNPMPESQLKVEMSELDDGNGGLNSDFMMEGRPNNMPLVPPPMPPQGLMAHLQGGGGGDGPSGPTWELGPFGLGQMGGNFNQQSAFHSNEQRDGPRFGGTRGGPRGMMGVGSRGSRGGSFRGGSGNRGGRR